jgi:hypothetical protein
MPETDGEATAPLHRGPHVSCGRQCRLAANRLVGVGDEGPHRLSDPERADPDGAAGFRFEQLVRRRLAIETGGRKAERDCRTEADAKTADPLAGFVTMFQKATLRAMEPLDRVAGCAVPFRANIVENERADSEVIVRT